ncbi:isochorismate synthase [Salirhabdus salicampi]|uniref:isochorismate synthase n=1 Tax=Salirhabdus salicampi TaxID=476102 RepID=UPI0020C44C88|nr:isochorismate synthase [Salirhabdus salicampi]MCP8617786.1 isochorismate synthase [Salirhabdus salicampi]
MIEVQQQQLIQAIQNAKRQLHDQEDSLLFSYTEKIDRQNPIDFFGNGAMFRGTRFYWTSYDKDFSLVGLNSVYMLIADQNRFAEIDHEWQKVKQRAYEVNEYNVLGTGPLLMGGFSFDSNQRLGETWKNFHGSKMVVPEFLLTNDEQSSYVTYNFMLTVDTSEHEMMDRYNELLFQLLQPYEIPSLPQQQAHWDMAPEEWKGKVAKATKEIEHGDLAKVVLAREHKLQFTEELPVASVLANLHEQQKQSYIFAFESGQDCFVGATPERLVRVEDGELLSTCLAGTAPRGNTVEEDKRIGEQLLHDEKNIAEHKFVVDMIRQAVDTYCDYVHVPDYPILSRLQNLQHLYTPVKGKLKEEFTILDVVKKLHPTPAMGGVPREKALAFIREEELFHRGWYAAPIGWMDLNGDGEFAVAIRSALVSGNEASLFAGCGIVKDSDPQKEFEETEMKFKPMVHALGG